MKSATTIELFKKLWQTVRQAGFGYSATVILTIILSGLSFFVWHQFGADQTIPLSYLLTTHGLTLLNIALSLIIVDREPFASSLLVGTAFIYELLISLFLYLI